MRPSRALLQAAMDKIHMRGMTFTGFHGVLDAERALGQKFVVDVTMSTDTREAGVRELEDKWRERPFVSNSNCFVVPPMKFATNAFRGLLNISMGTFCSP